MAGVTIRYGADPSEVLSATSDVEDAVDDLGRRLGDASDEGRSAADDLSDSFSGAAGDIQDSADTAGESLEEVGGASEGAGINMRSLGRVSKEAMEGDLAGAVNAARPLLVGLGPAGVIAGGLIAGGIGLAVQAMGGLGAESELQKETVSENFREMAESGLEAWESVTAQNKRLSDAYADHEGEIQSIADLTELSFETVASAWAGNADSVAIVNAAYDEVKSNLRDIPGVSVEAANATIMGWNAIMGPLNDVNAGYDTASEKYQRLAKQQSDLLLSAVADAATAQKEVDDLGNILFTLSNGTKVVVDADTGLASQNVDTFKGDLDGIPEQINTTLLVEADTSAAQRAIGKLSGKVKVTVTAYDQYGRVIP